MKNLKIIIFAFVLCFLLGSCKKEFLETKPDQSLIVPKTLSDYQAILDNDVDLNGDDGGQGVTPSMGEGSSDNVTLNTATLPLISSQVLNYYLWNKNVYQGDPVFDWNRSYRVVFIANVVLEGVEQSTVGEKEKELYNNIKGSALFYRAYMLYQLAQVFAPPYDKNDLDGKFGVPLRLRADVGEKLERATLKDTYEKIVTDLLKAKTLLPLSATFKTRPSQIAVDALLARVYQTIEDYDSALKHANFCLEKQGDILDYNILDPTTLFSFSKTNPEIIFYSLMNTGLGSPVANPRLSAVSIDLFNSYNDDDLRKTLYFKTLGTRQLFLGYSPSLTPFTGLATDEVYLIRAECYARKNKITESMEDLNKLMVKRWRKIVAYPTITALDAEDALMKVLTERRKELVYRGLRWTDLRRLNQEPKFAITLTRVLNGITYTLPPNDPRYTYAIPDAVMGFNPGMPQNIR